MKIELPKTKKFKLRWDKHVPIIILISAILILGSYFSYNKITSLENLIQMLTQEKDENLVMLETIAKELEELKSQDQLKRNEELQGEIENIQKTYKQAVVVYDDLVELKEKSKKNKTLGRRFRRSAF